MNLAVALLGENEDAADGPWQLPDGWCWSRLSLLTSFIGRGRGPTYVEAGGVPVVNQKCIRWHRFDSHHLRLTSRTAFDKLSPELRLRAGDLLWNSTGTGTIGRAIVYDGSIAEITVDSHVTIVRPTTIDPRYLGYLVETSWVKHQVNEGHVGSTNQRELPRTFVENLSIPLAPLPEQRRIVAQIDALFAEIADGEAALEDAKKGLETFRRALLKSAVTGELTKDWRATNKLTETGHHLLARIKAARVAQASTGSRLKRRQGATPLDTTDLPQLPEGWAWVTLGELTSFITSGSRGWKEFYAAEGAIFVRAQNINSGRLDLSDVAYVALPKNAEGLRTRLQLNDLLVTITGANVTISARMAHDIPEAYVNQHVALVRLIFPELAPFILLWLQSDGAGRTQLVKSAYGAGKPGLNLDNIRDVTVAQPPPDEAAEILRRVSEALSAASDTAALLEAEAADAARLRQSILKAAFEGRLVEQDSDDKPASALMERIRARSQSVAFRARRRKK